MPLAEIDWTHYAGIIGGIIIGVLSAIAAYKSSRNRDTLADRADERGGFESVIKMFQTRVDFMGREIKKLSEQIIDVTKEHAECIEESAKQRALIDNQQARIEQLEKRIRALEAAGPILHDDQEGDVT